MCTAILVKSQALSTISNRKQLKKDIIIITKNYINHAASQHGKCGIAFDKPQPQPTFASCCCFLEFVESEG